MQQAATNPQMMQQFEEYRRPFLEYIQKANSMLSDLTNRLSQNEAARENAAKEQQAMMDRLEMLEKRKLQVEKDERRKDKGTRKRVRTTEQGANRSKNKAAAQRLAAEERTLKQEGSVEGRLVSNTRRERRRAKKSKGLLAKRSKLNKKE